MRYRTFAPKRDDRRDRMESTMKVARKAEAEYHKFVRSTNISEEVKGFKVFLDGLPKTWKHYDDDRFSMVRGYSTVHYHRDTGEWVWMIDSDRFGKHGWTSADPHEVLAVMLDYKV